MLYLWLEPLYFFCFRYVFFVFDKGTSKLDILVPFYGQEPIHRKAIFLSFPWRHLQLISQSMNFIQTSWGKLRELLNVARSNARPIPKMRSNKNQNFTQTKQNIKKANQTSSYQRMQVFVATSNISWHTAVSLFISFYDRLLNSFWTHS